MCSGARIMALARQHLSNGGSRDVTRYRAIWNLCKSTFLLPFYMNEPWAVPERDAEANNLNNWKRPASLISAGSNFESAGSPEKFWTLSSVIRVCRGSEQALLIARPRPLILFKCAVKVLKKSLEFRDRYGSEENFRYEKYAIYAVSCFFYYYFSGTSRLNISILYKFRNI